MNDNNCLKREIHAIAASKDRALFESCESSTMITIPITDSIHTPFRLANTSCIVLHVLLDYVLFSSHA